MRFCLDRLFVGGSVLFIVREVFGVSHGASLLESISLSAL